MRLRRMPRRWQVRGVIAAVILALVLYAGVATASHDRTQIGAGNITEPADNVTVISVQGFHFEGRANARKPSGLVAVEGDGDVAWRNLTAAAKTWYYDVDPMDDGHYLVTSTVPGDTVVYEYDPDADERVWEQRLDAKDTHDVDMLREDALVVANLRNYDPETGRNDDRVYVYNLTRDEITWQWRFERVYTPSNGGSYTGDWTHVNDVEVLDDGRLMVSPRNMDQVLLINRSTKEVVASLGKDGHHNVLYEQHNPDFFRDDDGNPTILVSDSENDRVVEYTRVDGEWRQTWAVTGFNWPRDADRLPNGNTLVVDSLHQRVVEITPEGEVVWEFYAPWAPYDAERRGTGDESAPGPAMRDLNASGTYAVHGGQDRGPASGQTVADTVIDATENTSVAAPAREFARRWAHVSPFVRPIWLSDWAFAALVLAGVVATLWLLAELSYQRRRVLAAARSAGRRVRNAGERARDRPD